MNQEEYCENCLYFSPLFTKGTCRRYAPSPIMDPNSIIKGYAIWPTVDPNDFCGEWVEIPPGEALKSKEKQGKIVLEKPGSETKVDDSEFKKEEVGGGDVLGGTI